MEQVNNMNDRLMTVLKSIFETVWAIGTSVAATGVLKEPLIVNESPSHISN